MRPDVTSWASGPKRKPAESAQPLDQSTAGQLRRIVATITGCDDDAIKPESTLYADLMMDSLDLTEFCMVIADDLGVSVPDDFDFDQWKTFGDLVNFVERQQVRA